MLRPLHIVLWRSSIAPSFVVVFSLSLHCPHHSLSSKPLHLRPSLYFAPIQLLLSKTCAPQCKPFPHLWFSAVLPNPLWIRIKHPMEHTYRGCTHSSVALGPVSILLVVCSALHHTAVSRLITVNFAYCIWPYQVTSQRLVSCILRRPHEVHVTTCGKSHDSTCG